MDLLDLGTWTMWRLFAGTSSCGKVVRFTFQERFMEALSAPSPQAALSLEALLCFTSLLFEEWSLILFDFPSVWLPFPTHSSSRPQGISFLLWAHRTRIRMYSWNTLQGSLPKMFCILHLAWISILALLYRKLHQDAGPLLLSLVTSAAYGVIFSLFVYLLVGWIFVP